MRRHNGLTIALLAGLAAGLAGCGKQGVLEQPPPLFGSKAKAEYEARRAQEQKDDEQRARQTRGQQQPDREPGTTTPSNAPSPTTSTGTDNAPLTTRDVRDPAQILSPASQSPIAGAPNPVGAPVQTRPNF